MSINGRTTVLLDSVTARSALLGSERFGDTPAPIYQSDISVGSTDVGSAVPVSVSLKSTSSFVDLIRGVFIGGHGGNPGAKIRRPTPGGPGYAGHGGDIYIECSEHETDLSRLQPFNTHSYAKGSLRITGATGEDGAPERDSNSRGKHAIDSRVFVPPGTIVRRENKDGKFAFWHQFISAGDRRLCAKGGLGGLAPSSPGKHDGRKGASGERVSIELELRLRSDVALIGFPRSGKSSLLTALTSRVPALGSADGDTASPQTGDVRYQDGTVVRIADLVSLPLTRFSQATRDRDESWRILRHAWRARILIIVVDATQSKISGMDPLDNFERLIKLILISEHRMLQSQRVFIVCTKCDALEFEPFLSVDSLHYRLKALGGRFADAPIFPTSAVLGLGVQELASGLYEAIHGALEPELQHALVANGVDVAQLNA